MQQRQRIEAESASEPLDSTQREIALAPLDTAEVRPVHAKTLRERLLAVSLPLTLTAQIRPDVSLQPTFHHRHVPGMLLISLHTYK